MSNIFGNATQTTSGGLFGAPPATAATKPPTSIFGAPTQGASPFGSTTSSTPTPAQNAAASIPKTAAPSPFSTPAPAADPTKPTSSIFGGGPTNLFGAKPADAATPATPANLFGAPKPATSTPTPNIFGGGTKPAEPTANLFGAPKPAETSSTATANLFGAKPPTAAPPSSTPASNLFGVKPPETSTTTTSAATANLFGAKPAETTAPTTQGTAGSNLFAGANLFSKPATSTTPAPPADKAPSPSPFAGLGASKPAEKKDSAPAPTGLGLGLGLGATAPAAGIAKAPSQAPGGLGAAAASVSVQPPSILRGKTIEEIVNKWTAELETHVTDFNKFAGEVAAWDRALIENGNNLAALFSHVQAAQRDQDEIDQSLDHIEQQQRDLATTLDAYEKITQEIFGGQGGGLRALDSGPADTERDKNYMLATDLHNNLEDLSSSLTQMIETVNSLSQSPGPENNADEPISQIAQILSSHLESLQWIDGAVRDVETKVSEVEKRVKDSSANPTRGFGLR